MNAGTFHELSRWSRIAAGLCRHVLGRQVFVDIADRTTARPRRPDMTSGPVQVMSEPRRQVGALPFRRDPDVGFLIYLITSRESRRWVIPKGWPMKGRKPHEAAAREAYEEAGLVGQIGKRPLGFYLYEKRLKSRDSVLCQVKVFPLEVRRQLKAWPEQDQREGRWFTPSDAAEAVTEAGLAGIIRAASKRDLGKVA